MKAEHGIEFNHPYVMANLAYYPQNIDTLKSKYKANGSSATSGVTQTNEVLIPLSVIGDTVFCVSMVNRLFTTPTEWEMVTPYQGAPPQTQSYHYAEQERLAYFALVPLKDFIDQWKLKD